MSLRSALAVAVLALGELAFVSHAMPATETPGAAPAANQFRIAGVVVSSAGGGALAQTRVTIRETKNAKNVQSTLTGDDGRFEFLVEAGKYSLQGEKRGFITAAYDEHEQFSSAIVTGAGLDTEHLRLQLAPTAALSGRVLDESGEPVRQARVVLWREGHNTGVSRTTRFRTDTTDDLGSFEFTRLDSGTYFLSVSTTPWYAVHPVTSARENGVVLPTAVDRGLDVVYPTTYYAGATESDDATPIPLRGGDRLEVDLHMAPVPALHVLFRGAQNDERHTSMPVMLKRAFDGIEVPSRQESIQMVSPDVFEITTAPGKYTVQLAGQNVTGRVSEVDISQDHQEVEASSGTPMSKVNATVQVAGEAGLPRDLYLALRDGRRRTVGYEQVSSQGEVKFANVEPGTYQVVAASEDDPYAVVRITCEGQASAGSTLKVPAGSSLSVTLTLEKGSGSVEGFVKHGGKGFAGAMVVLIPKNPETNLERFRRDQSDLDGSFLMKSVIPGTYTVVAIADGWDLEWSRAAAMAKYAKRGATVVVTGQGNHAVQLPEAVEVQGK